MYYRKLITFFILFLILLPSVLTFVSGAGDAGNDTQDKGSGLIQCYSDRLFDNGIECILCGTDEAKSPEDCHGHTIFDSATCTCVPDGVDCQDKDASEFARACLDKDPNNFYNYNYCVCLDNNGNIVSATPSDDKSDNVLSNIKSDLFFKTNFNGTVKDIPEFIRMLFIIVFMIIAIVAMFLGIYGMYVYSMAGEDDEKVQLAQKIFKNALIGLAIAVFGVLIVQLIAGLFGVSDGLFDFTFDVS